MSAVSSQPTLLDRFRLSVQKWPGSVAVTDGRQSLTYADLERLSREVAVQLRQAGATPHTLIGLRVPRGVYQVVSILAIFECGAAYVPIDPAYPKSRQDYVEKDAGIGLIAEWDDEHQISRIVSSGSGPAARSRSIPDLAAYAIYTSGSTGPPKGVVVGHEHVLAMFDSASRIMAPDASDVWTLFHSSAFDFSVWEMWGSLLSGGRLVVVSAADARDPIRFAKLLQSEDVTVLNQVPTAFGYLVSALEETSIRLPSLRHVLLSGETVNMDTVDRWHRKELAPNSSVHNLYGITETTVFVTECRLSPGDASRRPGQTPIGRPLPHLQIRLVDDRLRPVAPGEPGEILVSGRSVSHGYLEREELTRQRFVSIAPGVVGYRSGDWAVEDEAGMLHYIGRRDRQVQLRGYRIELGEIETAIKSHSGVLECAVVEVSNALGEPMLAAHFAPHPEGGPTQGEVRAFLRERLPQYMIPAIIRKRSSMPMSPTGKVDWELLKSES